MTCHERRLRLLLILLGGLPLACVAQQAPLTGGMLNTPAVAMATADAAPTYDDGHLGVATRMLLDMQSSGRHAGPPRPMPGDQATASYRRYLHSFDREIPEFFDAKVHQNGAGSP